MTPPRRVAAWWLVLAVLTWVTVFEWQARTAGERFAGAQVVRYARGQRVETLTEGNRRLQPAAAREATLAAAPVLAAGLAAAWAVSRRRTVKR